MHCCHNIFFSLIIKLGAQNPGIECGCDTYDDYVTPASEAIYIQQSYNIQVASSKSGKYRVEVSDAQYPNIVHLSVYYGNIVILSLSTRATGWGFSPDEDRFVMHGFDIHNKHWYILYNLNPDPSIEGEQAESKVNPGSSDVSSARLRFSPHGKYLLYGAIGNMGNLVLYIHNAVTGNEVYHPTAPIFICTDLPVFSLTTMNQTQNGTWKLSIDEKIITTDNGYPETIVHLTEDEFVLKEDMIDSQGNPYSTSNKINSKI